MPISSKLKILPTLDHLELTDVVASGKVNTQPHYHDQLAFAVVTKGHGFFQFRDGKHDAGPGAVVNIAPGEAHTSGIPSDNSDMHYNVLYVSKPKVNEVLAAEEIVAPNTIPFIEPVSGDPAFYKNFVHSYRSFQSELDTLTLESALLDLLVHLYSTRSTLEMRLPIVDRKPHYLQLIQDFLNDCYQHPVSLKQLSGLVHKSPSQIIRVFKRHLGITPHAFLLNVRIARAKELLASKTPIAEVAFRVGFHDQSHFHRHFKQITLLTPGDYLRST